MGSKGQSIAGATKLKITEENVDFISGFVKRFVFQL